MGNAANAAPLVELELLTTEQVADALHVSTRHVQRLVKNGELAATPVGVRCLRFTRENVRRWLEQGGSHTQSPVKKGRK